MDEHLTFGHWLRRSRKTHDLTQAELAAQVGCAVGTLRKLEADELRPSKELAARLAAHFGVPESERVAFVGYARGQANSPDMLPLPIATTSVGSASPATARRPSMRSSSVPPTNLLVLREPIIGRVSEQVAIQHLLERPDVGLVTLAGPGGTGKTRLALHVAASLRNTFPDGVWFVDLAPIRDPALVAAAIAMVLDIQDHGGAGLPDRLRTYLRDKQLLLLLDNFEQVVTAAPLVADLLAASPGLKVLITSRVVAGIYGEYDVLVSPLTLPDPEHLPPLDKLAQVEAVQLFFTRAQAATPAFALTPANAASVAELVQRLDGLPLAIELAAARLRHLPLTAVLDRLSSRLQLLTGGARTLPQRQQTLRDTLEWSYALLNPDEQRLFRRLGVFVGGWTLDAAEAVCTAEGDVSGPVLDGLSALVDHSLVQASAGADGTPRYTMLETVREYALEQLDASGEVEVLRRRHATYYTELGEEAGPELRRAQQAVWMARLEQEHNNVRAALRWSQAAAPGDATAAKLALRLATAIWELWSRGGYKSEGRRWLEGALTHFADPADVEDLRLRANALAAAGAMALYQGDVGRAEVLLVESRALCQTLDEPWGFAYVLLNLAVTAIVQQNWERAAALIEESLAGFRRLDDRWGMAWALWHQAGVLIFWRGTEPTPDEIDRGRAKLEECLAHARAVGDRMAVGHALFWLGRVAKRQGETHRACVLLQESLRQTLASGAKTGVFGPLMELASLAMHKQQTTAAKYAARIHAAVLTLASNMGEPKDPNHPEYQRLRSTLPVLQAQLGDEGFATAWAEGRAMSVAQAVAYALSEDDGLVE